MGPPRIGIPNSSHGGLQLTHGTLAAPVAPVNPNIPQPDGLPPGMQPRAGYVITPHPPTRGSMSLPTMTYGTPTLPQPPVPQPLIDQNTPPAVPTSPVAPPQTGSPYPQVPGPYYPVAPSAPGTMTIGSFWERWKKPILIGGGVAGGLGLIALIAVAASKRRAPAPY